ncbi:MAG TPA: T9SS type A sorting domain-containing protein, partial [Elusimicrobiota bacterium]|nr:T9SS type A sorting domain-containing protein [Elusimicrobiota bacterium]
TAQFSATALDQFTQALATPPSFGWTVSGGGTIGPTGLFTAGPTSGGPFTVTAAAGGKSGTAQVTVTPSSSLPPVIVNPAGATPATATDVSAALSVLGNDPGGTESDLTYTWAPAGSYPAAVGFSVNGTNASKNTLATFRKAGSYTLQVTLRTPAGATVASSVNVTVVQTVTSAHVSPPAASVPVGGSQQFAAVALDQFDQAIVSPGAFGWTVSGGGTLDGTGLFNAGSAPGGPFLVTATLATQSDTAAVLVVLDQPVVAVPASASPSPVTGTTTSLSVLGADPSGEAGLNYHWIVPAGVQVGANDSNAAKNTLATFSQAGDFNFTVVIQNAAGQTADSSVVVSVQQAFHDIVVSPESVTLAPGGTQAFSAEAFDQFGQQLTAQPAFAWSTTGGGSMNSSTGFFTADSASGGPYMVTAAAMGHQGTASLTVQGPDQGSLPDPDLSAWSLTVSLDDALSVNYDLRYNVSFIWTFNFESNAPGGSPGIAGSPSVAPTASFRTGARTANLASYGLLPGAYLVTVEAVDNTDPTNVSKAMSATVTLVSADFSQVKIYPNPWRSDRHGGQPLTFGNVPPGSTIKIFTLSGHLVRTIQSSDSSTSATTWDLTNDGGSKVASGLYLYLATDAQGNRSTGKISIIR